MAELRVRNVQEAYVRGLHLLRTEGVWETTRNGRALVHPEPVLTVYERPWERVLLDPARDANPFFHLLEAFWMLAGRRDVASIARYNSGMTKYSDDGVSYHGAYGHRWRDHFYRTRLTDSEFLPKVIEVGHLDQISRAIELLRANPSDRRVVIAMWDPSVDLGREGLDFPCNTHVYLRGRERSCFDEDCPTTEWVLDLTVCCRSNDAIWGAYGSNAVHFSVLHELLAAATGMRQGRMYQLSNNLHAYESALEKIGESCWPVTWAKGGNMYRYVQSVPLAEYMGSQMDDYKARELKTVTLFRTDTKTPADEIMRQMDYVWAEGEMHEGSPFVTDEGWCTVDSMRCSWDAFKKGRREAALDWAHRIASPDWARACEEWLLRRYEEKT